MSEKIFLDNNATTQCDEEVLDVMLPFFRNEFANPSSIYSIGTEVKKEISNARKKVAQLINAEENEILFTSCASESNVTAINSAVKSNPEKKHIITTKIEHTSIQETMKNLEKNGYKITYIDVDSKGRIDVKDIQNAITSETVLITVMMANNEIGNIYPIKEIGKIANEKNILFHCDAVQAIGKIPVDVKELNVDTLTIAAHKINGPKGIGALYVKNGINFEPLIFGHQENNRRGGTENVPYIIGFGKAAELIYKDGYKSEQKAKELRDYMEEKIKSRIEDFVVYGDITNRIPNTSSIAFKDIKSEELMYVLEAKNIYVSTGSACNSEIAMPSHVLVACNADLENYSPIRISIGKHNTKEEIDYFVKALEESVRMLRRKIKNGE